MANNRKASANSTSMSKTLKMSKHESLTGSRYGIITTTAAIETRQPVQVRRPAAPSGDRPVRHLPAPSLPADPRCTRRTTYHRIQATAALDDEKIQRMCMLLAYRHLPTPLEEAEWQARQYKADIDLLVGEKASLRAKLLAQEDAFREITAEVADLKRQLDDERATSARKVEDERVVVLRERQAAASHAEESKELRSVKADLEAALQRAQVDVATARYAVDSIPGFNTESKRLGEENAVLKAELERCREQAAATAAEHLKKATDDEAKIAAIQKLLEDEKKKTAALKVSCDEGKSLLRRIKQSRDEWQAAYEALKAEKGLESDGEDDLQQSNDDDGNAGGDKSDPRSDNENDDSAGGGGQATVLHQPEGDGENSGGDQGLSGTGGENYESAGRDGEEGKRVDRDLFRDSGLGVSPGSKASSTLNMFKSAAIAVPSAEIQQGGPEHLLKPEYKAPILFGDNKNGGGGGFKPDYDPLGALKTEKSDAATTGLQNGTYLSSSYEKNLPPALFTANNPGHHISKFKQPSVMPAFNRGSGFSTFGQASMVSANNQSGSKISIFGKPSTISKPTKSSTSNKKSTGPFQEEDFDDDMLQSRQRRQKLLAKHSETDASKLSDLLFPQPSKPSTTLSRTSDPVGASRGLPGIMQSVENEGGSGAMDFFKNADRRVEQKKMPQSKPFSLPQSKPFSMPRQSNAMTKWRAVPMVNEQPRGMDVDTPAQLGLDEVMEYGIHAVQAQPRTSVPEFDDTMIDADTQSTSQSDFQTAFTKQPAPPTSSLWQRSNFGTQGHAPKVDNKFDATMSNNDFRPTPVTAPPSAAHYNPDMEFEYHNSHLRTKRAQNHILDHSLDEIINAGGKALRYARKGPTKDSRALSQSRTTSSRLRDIESRVDRNPSSQQSATIRRQNRRGVTKRSVGNGPREVSRSPPKDRSRSPPSDRFIAAPARGRSPARDPRPYAPVCSRSQATMGNGRDALVDLKAMFRDELMSSESIYDDDRARNAARRERAEIGKGKGIPEGDPAHRR